jgi:hypothetical protein
MSDTFTLVCYRPNGIDDEYDAYPTRTDSELAIYEGLTFDAAVERIVACRVEDKRTRFQGFGQWEIHVLVGGSELKDDSAELEAIEEAVYSQLQAATARAEAEAKQKLKEGEARAKRAKERRDRSEYARLKHKFEGS